MENENQTDLEEVINEVENETPQEEVVEESAPELDLEKFESKDDPDVIKIDLSKPPPNETKESDSDDSRVVGGDESPESPQEQEEVQPQGEVQETELPVLEEVTEEEIQQVEEQVVVIFSGVRGHLDKISINDITKFEKYPLEKIRNEGKQILESLKREQSISDELDKKLGGFVENVVKNFLEENNAKSN